jgi:hypothetical protein
LAGALAAVLVAACGGPDGGTASRSRQTAPTTRPATIPAPQTAPTTARTTAATAPPPTTGALAGPAVALAAAGNRVGVMLSQRLGPAGTVRVATELGAAWVRPEAVFLVRPACATCDAARAAGLRVALTVRNADGRGPSTPPADMAAFRRAVGEVLDRFRPDLLVVENEENSALFWEGEPDAYGAELAAACAEAHRRRIPCTNGGLVSDLVVLLTYDHYVATGRPDRAADLAARTLSPEERAAIDSPRARAQLERGRVLLAADRRAGADYLNIHWYEADTAALAEAVEWLRVETGLAVLTNEVGQTTDDPAVTTAVVRAISRLGLPLAVWFGLDGPKARGLVDPDGTLRPTGVAFRDAVRGG